MIRIFENIGRRLIDRRRPRTGDGIRLLARMQAERIEFEQLGVDHGGAFRAVGYSGSNFGANRGSIERCA